METAKIRKYFKAILLGALPRVYYGHASASAKTPYGVFSLQEISREDGVSLQELEVDVVDYGTDTEPAEAAADAVEAALDHLHELTEDFHISVYPERRQPLSENDKSVIRRRLTFQVRLHGRR